VSRREVKASEDVHHASNILPSPRRTYLEYQLMSINANAVRNSDRNDIFRNETEIGQTSLSYSTMEISSAEGNLPNKS
jgi:hypothetical protein